MELVTVAVRFRAGKYIFPILRFNDDRCS